MISCHIQDILGHIPVTLDHILVVFNFQCCISTLICKILLAKLAGIDEMKSYDQLKMVYYE